MSGDDEQNSIGWAKPDWTKQKLRSTGKSAAGNLAKPITNLPHQKETPAFEKPQWTSEVKEDKGIHGDLAKPITSLPHMNGADSLNFKKPEWTSKVKEDKGIHGDLAKPITSLPHGGGDDKLNFQKPEWTKNLQLNNTGKADKLKSGQDIARPIGGIKNIED